MKTAMTTTTKMKKEINTMANTNMNNKASTIVITGRRTRLS